jgi:hypothetical protein
VSTLASMVVELSANTAALTQGLNDAVKIATEKTESIKRTVEGIGAAIGIGLGASEFKEWINGSIEAADQAIKMSQKIGIATESIAGLASAAQKSNIDVQAFQASMVKLSNNAAQAANGVKNQAASFAALGISVKDAEGNLKSSDALLEELADKFSKYADGTTKTAAAVAFFGKQGAALIPMLNGGSEAIKRQIELTQQLGASFTQEGAANAEKFKDTMSDLSLVSKGLGNTIAQALLPSLNEFAETSLEFFRSDTWKIWLDKVSAGFSALASTITGVAKIVAENFGAIVTAITTLAEVKIAQWALAAAAGIASMAKEAALGATLWAEFKAGTVAASVATTGLSVAAGAGTLAVGAFNTVCETLLATIGGIPGVLALVAVGLYQIATYQDAGQKATNSLNEALQRLNSTTGETIDADSRAADAAKKAAEAEIARGAAVLATLEAQQQANQMQHLGAMSNDLASMAYLHNSAAIDDLKQHLKDARTQLDSLNTATNTVANSTSNFGAIVTAAGRSFAAGDLSGNMAKFVAASNQIHAVGDQMIAQGASKQVVYAAEDKALTTLSTSLHSYSEANKQAMPNVAGLGDVQDKAAAKARKLAQDSLDAQKFLDGLAKGMGGPYEQATQEWNSAIEQADKMALKFAADGKSVAEVQKFIADATSLAAQKFQEQTDAGTVITKLLDDINDRYSKQNDLLGLSGQALETEVEYQKLLTEADKALLNVMGPLTEADQKRLDGLHSLAAAQVKLTDESKLNLEAAKEWQGVWSQAGNSVAETFSKALVEGGSLMKGLADIAKQTVEAIIAYFTRLAIINPILNAIFGGGVGGGAGFSMLPTLANAAISGGGAGGAAGGQFDMFSASSWVSAGKNLWSGFTTGSASAGSSFLGSWSGNGSTAITSSGYGVNLPYATGGTYTPSGFGSALGIAGGLYAGYNEYNAAGGGAAGLAGGLTYGVGTVAAAGALGSLAAGGTAAAGVAGGMGTIGLGAIPVVGWIALAAMALNMITKGGLFGTAWNPTGNTGLNVSTDASGIDVGATAEEKKKKALFQGSKTRTIDIDVPQATIDSLNKFFDTLNKGLNDFAEQFGRTGAAVLDSTFKQTFDKKGNVTSTTETIGGQTYNDTTGQQYEERLQALSFEKVLTDMGISVKGFIDNASDADTLMQQVQDVAGAVQEANTNLANGFKFMGLASDQTLKQVVDFVEGLNVAGETLQQTYDRLAAAQQQYDQFVGQFVPPTQYIDPFEAALSQLEHQEFSSIKTANDLAKAAGASGASLKDLTNIQNFYGEQMKALIAGLQSDAQSLAYSLGLTTQGGSLSDVNSDIASLEAKANAGSTAVQGFGSAMGDAAQKATDAMNLLLGNLSPLNDQQKLQTALQGLRAGTVTADQVLEIGRRLYASSEAYTELFNTVKQYSGKGTGSGHSGGGSSGGGLTAAEQARLQSDYAQRDKMQGADNLQKYTTFAQEVAELATAKGEDFTQVLEEMGVKQSDLEKGLGLKDDAALRAYIEGFQKNIDSAGENTTSIVQAIHDLPAQIAAAINGQANQVSLSNRTNTQVTPPTGPNYHDPNHDYVGDPISGPSAPSVSDPSVVAQQSAGGSPDYRTPQHVTPGRTITDGDAAAIGAAVSTGNQPILNAITNLPSRNLRMPANAR